jgi:hypothetical protein
LGEQTGDYATFKFLPPPLRHHTLNVKPLSEILDRGGPFVLAGDIDHWNLTIKGILLDGDERVGIFSDLFYKYLDVDYSTLISSMTIYSEFKDDTFGSKYLDANMLAEISSDDKIIDIRFRKFNTAYDELNNELSKLDASWMQKVKKDAVYGVRGHEMLQNFDLGRRSALRQIARLCILKNILDAEAFTQSADATFDVGDDNALAWVENNRSKLEKYKNGDRSCYALVSDLTKRDEPEEDSTKARESTEKQKLKLKPKTNR